MVCFETTLQLFRFELFHLFKLLFCLFNDPRSLDFWLGNHTAGMPRPLCNSENAVGVFVDVTRELTSFFCALEMHPRGVTLFRPRLLVVACVDVDHPSDDFLLRREALGGLRDVFVLKAEG